MNLYFRFCWLMFVWRLRPPVTFFEEAATPFRVWPTDLDTNLHMNNGVYLSLMDLGRIDLILRNKLAKKLKEKQWFPVVASQMIRYRKSLDPFKKFYIKSQLLGWDDRFFYVQQRFIHKEEVVALALVKARFLKKSGGGVTPSDLAQEVGVSSESPKLPVWISDWTSSEDHFWKKVNS